MKTTGSGDRPTPYNPFQQNPHLSQEWQLLFRLSLSTFSVAPAQELEPELFRDLDWQAFLHLALQQGVTALVSHNLRVFYPHVLPSSVSRTLQTSFLANRMRTVFLTRELARLLEGMGQRNLIAIPYKGPTLAQLAYQDLGLRKFTDLDLLVKPEDFRQAGEFLLSQGYSRKESYGWEESFFHPQLKVEVDLHQSLVPPEFSQVLGADFLIARLTQLQLNLSEGENLEVPCLQPEDLFVLLCLYLAKDHCCLKLKLCQLVDAMALVKSHPCLDWKSILETVEMFECVRLLLLQLKLLEILFNLEVPQAIIAGPYQEQYQDAELEVLSCQILQRLVGPQVDYGAGFFFPHFRKYDHRFYFSVWQEPRARIDYCRAWARRLPEDVIRWVKTLRSGEGSHDQ